MTDHNPYPHQDIGIDDQKTDRDNPSPPTPLVEYIERIIFRGRSHPSIRKRTTTCSSHAPSPIKSQPLLTIHSLYHKE